ncbi:MAG TPA: 5-methyltetrahydropteroyltriglutamate--homocysteine S-methyltransferase [Bryobacteraceae bacterium]|nr:5-methyltetrahydropteroyltriglutamate--homocysteine S-methyltransferase [Bryobacteraceae bacterium]
MSTPHNLGFARMGANRELKKAEEAFWSRKLSQDDLLQTARKLREQHWSWQAAAGLPILPCGDFSLYDQVLDTALLFDVIPSRFRGLHAEDELTLYFAMARGTAGNDGVPALEMTKWFDTNYHYLVPEFSASQQFRLARNLPLDNFREAAQIGFAARPVLLGPITFLLLGKMKEADSEPLDLLDRLLPAYETLLQSLAAAGVSWVQIDEPVLATDLPGATRQALVRAFNRLARVAPLRILLATYFGALGDNLPTALQLPVAALHLDLVRGPEQLEAAIASAPDALTLSLGLIDGRNIWKTDLGQALDLAERAAGKLGPEKIMIAPSCSLLHVPIDLTLETKLAPEVKDWLAFGRQKLDEVVLLSRAINEGRTRVREALDANEAALSRRKQSPLIHNPSVQDRLAAIKPEDFTRPLDFVARKKLQQARLALPPLPTTTIGSFPQTPELRRERARRRKGEITAEQYEQFVEGEIAQTIREQERLGLDVLVHGEPERNDMVEYFGELLSGFAFTENGWVQSYGARCVKPPIIFGDVMRSGPMTVKWWQFAQSLTKRPVKGMLTGPVTILEWSFVRDDQPRRDTCFQLALALRDEILDLEKAGCRVVQLDEPALREGMPLAKAEQSAYLDWAVNAFRLATSGVAGATQIHTHMCYAEFNDILHAIAAMDADVISMESARSQMELMDSFARYHYKNDVGPGIYDIHSPRIPSTEEMRGLLEKALVIIPAEQLWVNPDCGLKTRSWAEVTSALHNLVQAAQSLRVP